ncbi:Transcription factor MYB88-like protein [Drosera capensis]
MQKDVHQQQVLPVDYQCDVSAAPKQKERRIVTWTQEEDDILRQQISVHGTENWTLIASKFNDKTTRQCRRRWYTYPNTDFKKGGWSPEEDMLLCEAHKIFGNRWTEIAKVVSGRTDNAVKNRFSTLCKKRAKQNSSLHISSNNKRVLADEDPHSEGTLDVLAAPLKKIRSPHISDAMITCGNEKPLVKNCTTMRCHPQPTLAKLTQKIQDADNSLPPQQFSSSKLLVDGEEKIEGAFLKKDDPKIAALIQQAELLSSLALKVNVENTEQSVESAWKILQDFLHRTKESEIQSCDILGMDLQADDVKDLMEELKCDTLNDIEDLVMDFQISDEVSQPSQRNLDWYESPSGSEYSTGSTIPFAATDEPMEQNQSMTYTQLGDTWPTPEIIKAQEELVDNMIKGDLRPPAVSDKVEILVTSDNMAENGIAAALSATEFDSPSHVTQLFRSLAETIPSPQFSERETVPDEDSRSPVPDTKLKHQSIASSVLQKGPCS